MISHGSSLHEDSESLVEGRPWTGLTSNEARRRLEKFGPNAVVEPHVSPVVRIARRFWEPVPWMLEASIILQLSIGEHVEALIIAALLIFNVALGVFQEGRKSSLRSGFQQYPCQPSFSVDPTRSFGSVLARAVRFGIRHGER